MDEINEIGLLSIINGVIEKYPNVLKDIQKGRSALNFLLGQIIKETEGEVSPRYLNVLLKLKVGWDK